LIETFRTNRPAATSKKTKQQVADPKLPAGSRANTITFAKVTTSKLRIVFTHKGKARSGATEIEVWRE
jgi:hypothetical protein